MKEMASECELRLIDHMDGSVTMAVNKAVGGMTLELYSRVQLWESQMGTQIWTKIQQHWDTFWRKGKYN